jgi:hypothetical protein
MQLKNETITKGFILSGIMNSSVLVFSRLFTNTTIAEFDPVVMSNFGLLMIFIWGLAYLSIAKNYKNVKWLIGVFAIEKLIYGCIWIQWMANNSVANVFKKDIMAGLFFSVYGLNDWLFFIFFSIVFVHLYKQKTI